jgi:hypothetical protein
MSLYKNCNICVFSDLYSRFDFRLVCGHPRLYSAPDWLSRPRRWLSPVTVNLPASICALSTPTHAIYAYKSTGVTDRITCFKAYHTPSQSRLHVRRVGILNSIPLRCTWDGARTTQVHQTRQNIFTFNYIRIKMYLIPN